MIRRQLRDNGPLGLASCHYAVRLSIKLENQFACLVRCGLCCRSAVPDRWWSVFGVVVIAIFDLIVAILQSIGSRRNYNFCVVSWLLQHRGHRQTQRMQMVSCHLV